MLGIVYMYLHQASSRKVSRFSLIKVYVHLVSHEFSRTGQVAKNKIGSLCIHVLRGRRIWGPQPIGTWLPIRTAAHTTFLSPEPLADPLSLNRKAGCVGASFSSVGGDSSHCWLVLNEGAEARHEHRRKKGMEAVANIYTRCRAWDKCGR